MDKKIIILTMLIAIFYHTSVGQNITYTKGNISSNIIINQVDTNGLKQGIWVYVYNIKKYYSVVKFKNDMITDTAKAFSFDNKLLNITMYKNDLKNGVYYDYDEKGRVKEERHYVNDSLNGILKEYINGKIIYEFFYKDNYPYYTKYYYNNEKLESEFFYVVRISKLTNKKYILDTLYRRYYKNGNRKIKSLLNINYYNDNDSLVNEKYMYRRDGSLKTKIISYREKKAIKQKYKRKN